MMHNKPGILFLILFGLMAFIYSQYCGAMGKKPKPQPAPKYVKKVVTISPIQNKYLELPDGYMYEMGRNVYDRIITKLVNSGRMEIHVAQDPYKNAVRSAGAQSKTISSMDPYQFPYESIVNGNIKIDVSELVYITGERGERQYFGFEKSNTNPFNDGTSLAQNEFPAKDFIYEDTWFGNRFDPIGGYYMNSVTGMDIGGGFNINVLVAGIGFRQTRYYAKSTFDMELSHSGTKTIKSVTLEGRGFYLEISGQYLQYSAEIEVTRKAALKTVYDKAIDRIVDFIGEETDEIPYDTKIRVIDDGNIIIGAGSEQGIQVGHLFYGRANRSDRTNIFRVVETYVNSSRVECINNQDDFEIGDTVRYAKSESEIPEIQSNTRAMFASTPSFKTSSESVQTERVGIDLGNIRIDYLPDDYKHRDKRSWWRKLVDGFVNTLILIYRVWRFFQYDQPYDGPQGYYGESNCPYSNEFDIFTTDNHCYDYDSDYGDRDTSFGDSWRDFSSSERNWALSRMNVDDAWNLSTGENVIIAVVDTGVDYNHSDLRANINLEEEQKLDFMSRDNRPFDDNYHGTMVASLIAGNASAESGRGVWGVSPRAKILPIKSFNPWGQTTSAAIYGGIKRAVDLGASVILLAWTTNKKSDAIRMGIEYAEENGVLVVVPAGDGGKNIDYRRVYPAHYSVDHDNIIVVAGTDTSDTIVEEYGSYSNFGPTSVDIAAPGKKIVAASPRQTYLRLTSTDYAAAYVAGVAALVKSRFPHLDHSGIKEKIFSGAEIIDSLRSSVRDGKRINALNALQ